MQNKVSRKLGVDEWLIKTVMTMCRNCNSVIRINSTVVVKFGVKVGTHQESALSHLLFIIVLETLSRECRTSLHWEILCADELVIIAESLEELEARYATYSCLKNCLVSKGLRLNLAKTRVMISDAEQAPINKNMELLQ